MKHGNSLYNIICQTKHKIKIAYIGQLAWYKYNIPEITTKAWYLLDENTELINILLVNTKKIFK
jgi:hypothetical protein